LSKVGIGEPVNRLGFHHHLVIHDQIHEVGVGDPQPFVGDVQVDFPEDLVAVEPEGVSQANLVSILE
jgi:hypothetical protein